MELTLIEPTNAEKSLNFSLLTDESYELTLSQSIQGLLHEHRKGISEFTFSISNFYELMQARVDPPLEAIWVYSALSFRNINITKNDTLNRVSATKDLFELVSACSASCCSSKSIALLAPVVFKVYNLVVELVEKDLSLKREKKAMREVVSLMEVILGYISICCSRDFSESDDDLITCCADLVCLWKEGNEEEETEGLLGSFLPLVNNEVCRRLSEGNCDVSYLAGVVIAEAFLLRLCLNIRQGGIPRAEMEKKLRSWAVGSITGFRNSYFFETLVRMLLELTLPVTSLLKSEDVVLLRKVLYDAVILVEYSFLNPQRVIQQPAERMKSLAMTRLVLTHDAIEYFRENGDQMRAISYVNAFSSSHLPSQIIKWVTNQIGMEGKASRQNGSSPKALIKWLLNLEDQGIRIFDDSNSKCRARLVLDISEPDYDQPAVKGKKVDADLFYIDNKGEEEDGEDEGKESNESMNAAFVAATHTMNLGDNDGGRKRKERRSIEKKKQIEFLKYNLCDNSDSAREKLSPTNNDGLNSGSEVENPFSDEDMEENDQ